MSNVVDERVVQMDFDNARFERNVSTSMSTLDKLKKSLNFDKSTKGFENITSSAKNVNLSGIEKAVETVNVKFSAMQVAGVAALANITNSAVNCGKRLVSSLTIDPPKLGLKEYETQLNAVQTILANTSSKGTTLDQVNSALDELNRYADMTIYNFTEMTRNIGTFTAAGVGLSTSVSAIKGIANLAAVSGSNAQQASTAMYQLSQALAAGTVKLQDWNSVVNAGMGGEVFQSALKDTARVHGIKVDEMIKKEGSFRESLKSGWITASVLTETLSKFTGDLNAEQLKSIGYTNEQVDAILKMGKTANDAATKVKTFTQLLDTLQEAAQSGWTQSWQIIIGNFEEAKDLFTEASDTLGDLISRSAEARNKFLTGGLMSEWGQFAEVWGNTMGNGIAGIESYKEIVKSVATEHGIQIDSMIQDMGSFEKTLKKGWLTTDIMNESIDKMTSKMTGLSSEELKASGYTKEHVDALIKLNEGVKNGTVSVGDFSDKVGEMSGREHLIQSIRNAFGGLMSVIKPVNKAFSDTFSISSDQLYNITVALDNLTSHLKLSGKQGDELYRTFRGLFAIVNVFTTLTGGALKVGLKLAAKLFGVTGDSVLELTATVGDAAVAFQDWLFQNNIVAKGLKKSWEGLTFGAVVIKNWIDAFSELPVVQRNIARFDSALSSTIANSKAYFGGGAEQIGQFIERVRAMDSITLADVKDIFKDFKENVVGYFLNVDGVFDKLRSSVKLFKTDIKTYFKETGDGFDGLQVKMASFIDFTSTKFSGIGLGELLTIGLGLSLILVIKKIASFVSALTNPIGSLAELFDSLVDAVRAYTMQLKANAILKISGAIAVLAGSIALLTLLDQDKMWSAVGALGALAGGLIILSGVMGALNKFTNFTVASGAILALSASLLILAVALRQMESLDPQKALTNIKLLGLIGSGLALVVAALSVAAPQLSKGSFMLVSMSAALKIMVKAISGLNDMNPQSIGSSIKVLLASMAGLALVALSAERVKFGGAGAILATAVSLKILISAINDIANMDTSKITSNVGAFVIVFGLFVGLMAATKLAGQNAKQAGISLMSISASLLLLSAAIKSLNGISLSSLSQALTVTSSMLLVFGGIIAISKLAGQNAVKAGAMIGLMAGAILALTVAVTILSKLKPDGLDRATDAIVKMQLCFGLIIAMTGLAKESRTTLVAIAATIGVLAVALATLSMINAENLNQATKSLSMVMGLFSVMVASTSLAKGSIAALAVMGVVVAELAGILYLLSGLETDKSIGIASSLSILILSLSGSLVVLSVVGATIAPALLGIVAMNGLVIALGGMMVGIGALVEKIPKIEQWLDKGIPILEKIGYGFGSVIGNIVGGITAGATSKLTDVGKNLSEFITSLEPFFSGIKNVDVDSISGVKALAETMLILTGTDILTKLTSWVTGGKSLSAFGDELVAFGSQFSRYAQSVSGIENMDVVTASANAAKALAELATNLPNSGGLAGWFAGENNFSDFSKGLVDFGKSLKAYSLVVVGVDPEVVTNSANAAMALAELAKNLPNSGGLSGFFAGENDFKTFSVGLVGFGQSLMSYSNSVVGLRTEDIQVSVTAAGLLSDLVKAMPNTGGLAGLFAGNNDFKTFSKGLVSFGQSLTNYAIAVGGLNTNAIGESVKAAKQLAELAKLDAGGIRKFTDALGGVAKATVDEFVGVFVTNASQAKTASENILKSFVAGIDSQIPEVNKSIQNAVSNINAEEQSFEDSGKYLFQGFINGMASKQSSVYDAAAGVGLMASNAVRDVLGIHSPAVDGIEKGKYYDEGIISGLKAKASGVWDAARGVALNLKAGASDGLKAGAGNFVKDVGTIFGGLGKAGSNLGDSMMDGFSDSIKQGSKKAGKAAKSLYDITKEWIDEEKYYHRLSLEEELAKWQEIQAKYKEGSEERKKIDREVYRVKNEIIDDTFRKEKEKIDDDRYYKRATLNDELDYWVSIQEKYAKLGDEYNEQKKESDKKVFQLREDVIAEAYSKEKEWIDDKKYYGQLSLSEELSYWKGIQRQFLAGSKERESANKEVYRVEKELAKEAYENAKNWISERKYYNELSLTEELYTWERLQDVYEEGSAERMEADREVYRLEQEINRAREEHAKSVADVEADAAQQRIDLEKEYYDATKQVNEQLKQDINDLNKEYDDAVKSRADSIAKSYSLFDYAKIGGGVEGTVLLDNLESQITAMDDWQKDINGLADRGISDDLLEELRGMGPSSAAEIKALNLLTNEQLDQYVALWQQKQAMAKNQAVIELEDMKKKTVEKIAELNATANKQLEEYKTTWNNQLAELNNKASEKLVELQTEFDNKIGTLSSDTKRKVRELTSDIEDAIDVSSENIVDQVTDLTENIKTAMETPDWVSIGTNIIAGIQKGITDKAAELAETAARVARDALEAAEDALDINSPSGEFENVGMYCDYGFANGLRLFAGVVKNQSKEVGNTAIDSIKGAVSRVSDLINSGMDTSPTIRPVLDLSDIEANSSRLNTLFGRTQAISVGASINRNNKAAIQNEQNSKALSGNVYNNTFNQTNNSPKALSRVDIYRQTKNQFSAFERIVKE